MRRFRIHLAHAALLSAGLLAPAGLAAQSGGPPAADTTAKPAAAPAPPTNSDQPPLAGLKLSGYAAGSYSYSGRCADATIVGRLYERLQGRFMLSALAVVLDKPYGPAK